MATMHEVSKGMEDNYRRGSYRDQTYNRRRSRSFEDRIEVGEMTEVGVTVDLGQVLG